MRKFIFSFICMMFMCLGINAQIATENSKVLDNISISLEGGVMAPLDFNKTFPLNSLAGIKISKDFTPVVGVEAEGFAYFNDNHFGRWTNTFVKGTNVGLNGLVNLTNLFNGYRGKPRSFEVKTNTGLGWMHYWNDGSHNTVTAKTGLEFDFNLGKRKAHTFFINPGVFWNLKPAADIQFNKNHAQFAILAGYTYHFKTSNQLHHFKQYDVGALIAENDRLNRALAEKPTEVVREVIKEVQVPAFMDNEVVVFFAKGSTELTNDAKEALKKVHGIVNVYGFASPEGTRDFNTRLSNMRAQVVADYLVNLPNHIKINACEGKGVQGNTSGRVTIVQVTK